MQLSAVRALGALCGLSLSLSLGWAQAGSAPPAKDMRQSILAKLEYDRTYFRRVLQMKATGRVDKRLSREELAHEVRRAQLNLPVLDKLFDQKEAYLAGQPLSLPRNDEAMRVYFNLAVMLNMLQAAEAGNHKAVTEFGKRVVIKDRKNLGLVQNDDANYYLNLYREYFYLMASAAYRQGKDGEAIQWLARLEADADVQKLKKDVGESSKPDPRAQRLAQLRPMPLAVVPFHSLDGNAATAWLSQGLPEVLSNDLVQHTDLVVVERTALAKVLKEVQLSQAGITDERAAKNVGNLLNAGTLLTGSFRTQGNELSLTLKLVDATDGRALITAEGTTPLAEVFPAARRVLVGLFTQLGWMDALGSEEVMAARVPKMDTVKDLLQARLMLASKAADAKALYAKAAREDPAYAKLFEDLKSEFSGISATLAVMPFVNASGAPSDLWMVHGVGQALNADLPKIGFTVVERAQLLTLVQERQVGQVLDPEAARKLGGHVGADFIVLGSLLHQKPAVRLDARFVDVKSGIVTQTVSAEGSSEEFMQVLVTLSTEIAKRFNEKLSEKQLAELSGKKMTRDEFEKYVRQELTKEALARSLNPKPPLAPGAPPPPSRAPFYLAVGGLALGTAATAGGFTVSKGYNDSVVYTDALIRFATRPEDQDRLMARRSQDASRAQTWNWVGLGGLGVLGVSAAYVAYDQFIKGPAPDGTIDLAPVAQVGPGGGSVGVAGSF